MKKVVVILGGGRPKGNTAQLVQSFAQGLTDAGHCVEIISLNKFRVNGCLGCGACRYEKPCIQKDDFMEIVPKIREVDMIALACPLYFWMITAKLKAFIEWLYSFAKEDPDPPYGRYEQYPEKDSVLLMTAADNNFWTFDHASSYYRYAVVNYIGFRDRGMYLAGGLDDSTEEPGISKTDHLQRVYDFGKNLYDLS